MSWTSLLTFYQLIRSLGIFVEMRYFGGMTVEETANALAVSTETVKRDWRLAKLWLLDELAGSRSPSTT